MFSHAAAQWFFSCTAFAALAVSLCIYFFDHNYMYVVEVPCDAAVQTCYTRDCDAGECPPYNISSYRSFLIHAQHVAACIDPTCANVCLSSLAVCTEMLCTEQDEIKCSSPQS